ncbi:hypothetical protein [Bradyrhizobium centrosematis]|nr:hypothetical protein [Bradyrhizobium centrosematis]MCS3763674.1 hypothetical protein [Bradyrhizobium centrosematis]MCS3777273.1 hypothetical protein [Bradyrhizobium centrosematis]
MSASAPSAAQFAAKIPQQFFIALQYIRQILLQKHLLGSNSAEPNSSIT